jgi:Kef-type K+ transport system membrane component KefB
LSFLTVFYEVAAILALAAAIGAVSLLLRQPLIVAYLVTGIVAGPAVLNWVTARDAVDLLARLGIALLLFVVGLKLDLHIIRTVGPVALITGLGQVLFTSAFGFLIALAFGMTPLTALYVAVALTFSSTIIIVKLLSDKREVDSLHGRIAIGFLIVQDIVVVAVLLGLAAIGGEGETNLGLQALSVLAKGVLLIVVLALLVRFAFPLLLRALARHPELLLLSAVAWALGLAALGETLGLSKEVGAFLAGVSLASTPYRELIAARLTSLRDFLLLFFFIDLGARIDMGSLGSDIPAAAVFSVFVLIGNPLIVMIIMGVMRYRARIGFLAGLTVAQISEFSLVLAAVGLSVGHITEDTVGLITLVGMITISASTYMITYSHPLYSRLAPWLRIFERRSVRKREELAEEADADIGVIVFGLGRFGSGVVQALHEGGQKVLAVDYDPQIVRSNSGEEDYLVRYGDAEDVEYIGTLPLHKAKWVVSTLRDTDIDRTLIQAVRQHGFRGQVAVAAHTVADLKALENSDVDLILVPYADAAQTAAAHILEETRPDEE